MCRNAVKKLKSNSTMLFDIFNMSMWIIKLNFSAISTQATSRCISKGKFTKKIFKLTWWDSTVDVITSLKDAIGSLDLSSMICKNGNQTKELITRLFLFKCYTYSARRMIEKHHYVVL